MALPFTDWKPSFLRFPARPEYAVAPAMFSHYTGKGWLWQYKMNGTYSIIGVSPTGEIHNLNRHGEVHKQWKPTDRTRKLVKYATPGKWTVFLCELIDAKTPQIKDTLYIFDLCVFDSEFLLGSTFLARQVLLAGMFPRLTTNVESHYVIEEGLWLARIIQRDPAKVFKEIVKLNDSAIEGLVGKDPQGTLEPFFREKSNQAWQIKVRRAMKNLSQTN
jgi:hypothetical protein